MNYLVMAASMHATPNSRSETTTSPDSTFPNYIQRLIAMEKSSSKRLMEALMQETSIPIDPSRSLGPATAERVERGGIEQSLTSKL